MLEYPVIPRAALNRHVAWTDCTQGTYRRAREHWIGLRKAGSTNSLVYDHGGQTESLWRAPSAEPSVALCYRRLPWGSAYCGCWWLEYVCSGKPQVPVPLPFVIDFAAVHVDFSTTVRLTALTETSMSAWLWCLPWPAWPNSLTTDYICTRATRRFCACFSVSVSVCLSDFITFLF